MNRWKRNHYIPFSNKNQRQKYRAIAGTTARGHVGTSHHRAGSRRMQGKM